MTRSAAVKVLLAAVLVAAVLLPQAHALVTSLMITRMESAVPYKDWENKGIDWEPDEIYCRLASPTNYTCASGCIGGLGAGDRENPDFCVPTLSPTCTGKWCSAKVVLEARLDSSPSSSNTRMIIAALPILKITQLSAQYITSKPYKVIWTFQISSAVALGTFADDEEYYNPFRPLITFTVAQQGSLTGLTASMLFQCQPLPGASATFQTPKVNCTNGFVEVNATVTGCPDIFEMRHQGRYINLFDGNLVGTTTADPTFPDQYPGRNHGDGSRDFNLTTLDAGLLKVTLMRNDNAWPRRPWPAGVTSIKIGHRLHSEGPDAPWKLSANKAPYEDKDVDGVARYDAAGKVCDCNDNDPTRTTNCGRRLRG